MHVDLLTVLIKLTPEEHDYLLVAWAASDPDQPPGSLPYAPLDADQDRIANSLIMLDLLYGDYTVTPLGVAAIEYDTLIDHTFFTPEEPPEDQSALAIA